MLSGRPYSVFLLVSGKPCTIIGGGVIAHRKALELLGCGARVTVVAETPSPEIQKLAAEERIVLVRRRFGPEDVREAFLVFAATDNARVNIEVSEAARGLGILVNAVDDPGRSDFISGSVLRRGPLQIAVSTSGCGPKIAARIRRELEERYPESIADFIAFAGELREHIFSEDRGRKHRDEALSWIASEEAFALYLRSGKERIWEEIRKILFSS